MVWNEECDFDIPHRLNTFLLSMFMLLFIFVVVSWWRIGEWPDMWEVAVSGNKGHEGQQIYHVDSLQGKYMSFFFRGVGWFNLYCLTLCWVVSYIVRCRPCFFWSRSQEYYSIYNSTRGHKTFISLLLLIILTSNFGQNVSVSWTFLIQFILHFKQTLPVCFMTNLLAVIIVLMTKFFIKIQLLLHFNVELLTEWFNSVISGTVYIIL
jgi:hypothetical protein